MLDASTTLCTRCFARDRAVPGSGPFKLLTSLYRWETGVRLPSSVVLAEPLLVPEIPPGVK